ncbi:hypothetical protein ACVGXA_07345, partial [Enterobacter hormaechei]
MTGAAPGITSATGTGASATLLSLPTNTDLALSLINITEPTKNRTKSRHSTYDLINPGGGVRGGGGGGGGGGG